METIEAEKYKAYQQKSLEIISNKIKIELIAEIASKTKVSKKYFSSVKKENLDKLNMDELSNVLENSTDPLEIQVIYLSFNYSCKTVFPNVYNAMPLADFQKSPAFPITNCLKKLLFFLFIKNTKTDQLRNRLIICFLINNNF